MLLKIRKNAQVTLPAKIREIAHLEDGDLLECKFRDGDIILTPKKLVDKRDAWFWSAEWQKAEAEAQKDIDSGDLYSFDDVEDAIKCLRKE